VFYYVICGIDSVEATLAVGRGQMDRLLGSSNGTLKAFEVGSLNGDRK